VTDVPPQPRPSGVGRALGWMPYVLLAVLLAAVVRSFAVPISNPDTFFHLRYGHEFLHGWTPWSPGHVSTYAHRAWVPTQWLSEIVMALTENVLGLAGVAWLAGLLTLVAVTAVFVVARRYADPLPSAVVTILVVLGSLANLSPRPQVISYVLILVITHVWLQTAVDLRPRWWLVPLTWVWALLHGMWPIGAVIGLVAVVGIALDQRHRLGELRGVLLRLAAVPVLSLLVPGVSPMGPRIYAAVLVVGGRGKFHAEWAATDFHKPQAAAVAVMIVLTLVVWLRSGTPRTWVSVVLLLLTAAWSAYAVRTVPVAAMMAVPLLAAALQDLVGSRRPAPARERWIVGGLTAASLVLLALLVPFTSDRPASVPSWVNPSLDRLPHGTPVQTTDVMGGWLMWRHPSLDPVIDGYSDAYTTAHLQQQLDLQRLLPGWDKTLHRTGVHYALLPTRSPLAYALGHLEGWHTLHTSKDVVMLQAPEGWDS
jgi:hypothetical protein